MGAEVSPTSVTDVEIRPGRGSADPALGLFCASRKLPGIHHAATEVLASDGVHRDEIPREMQAESDLVTRLRQHAASPLAEKLAASNG